MSFPNKYKDRAGCNNALENASRRIGWESTGIANVSHVNMVKRGLVMQVIVC